MKLLDSEDQLSEKELSSFEKKYHYNLPATYKELMLKFNGGFPEKPFFEEDELYFTPISHGDMTMEMLLDVTDPKLLPSGYFPFAEAGESLYCIATTETPSKIYRVDEDGEITEVSASFEDFINALQEEE